MPIEMRERAVEVILASCVDATVFKAEAFPDVAKWLCENSD
jgi:hypothetical protein